MNDGLDEIESLLVDGDLDNALGAFRGLIATLSRTAESEEGVEVDTAALDLFWVTLKHSFLLMQIGNVNEAIDVARPVHHLATLMVGKSQKCDQNCWCLEHSLATILIAKSLANLGDHHDAVIELRNASECLGSVKHSKSRQIRYEITRMIDGIGAVMGYRNLASRLVPGSPAVDGAGISWEAFSFVVLHKALGSSLTENYAARFQVLLERMVAGSSNSILQEDLLMESRNLLNVWSRDEPYSFELKKMTIRFECMSLSAQLQLSAYSRFEDIWTHTLNMVVALLEDESINSGVHQNLSLQLCVVGREILNHDFAILDTAEEFFKISAMMLGLAYGMFDESVPVTQANALTACLVAESVSTAYVLGEQSDLAAWEMERSGVILSELLLRDPSNDLALELDKGHNENHKMPSQTVLDEIAEWEWAVTPLI